MQGHGQPCRQKEEVMILFTVPVVPVAKARHRSGRMPNGKTIHYVDQKSRGDIETFIAYARLSAPAKPIEGAISVHVTVCLPIPKSWSKKKTESLKNLNLLLLQLDQLGLEFQF
jgi:Holliday junction resolvase RusA-like endonuclease